jgi:hypothetical protein
VFIVILMFGSRYLAGGLARRLREAASKLAG